MPIGIHNPLPSSMACKFYYVYSTTLILTSWLTIYLAECKKCGKILASFVDPRQSFGPEKVIPPQILANAKGLCVMTVFKAGFVGSGRYGNGIVVARLADGSWSAPSAVTTAGGGVGGQIGFELTDFVFILNDAAAVRSFSQAGSLTLGGNVSLAAGPIGRNAEAAGAASLKGVAGVFSYSKTKGLFAGVSLEGSAIIERRDANEKLYGRRLTAADLLTGAIRPPPATDSLMSVLNSQVFAGAPIGEGSMYNDVPIYKDNGSRDSFGSRNDSSFAGSTRPQRANTWNDDVYDRTPASPFGVTGGRNRASTAMVPDDYKYSNDTSAPAARKTGPGRPAAPKPAFMSNKAASLRKDEAIALFTFEADQAGDLGFKKGDVIQVTKKTASDNDWW